jgi:hypothetical protein
MYIKRKIQGKWKKKNGKRAMIAESQLPLIWPLRPFPYPPLKNGLLRRKHQPPCAPQSVRQIVGPSNVSKMKLSANTDIICSENREYRFGYLLQFALIARVRYPGFDEMVLLCNVRRDGEIVCGSRFA